MSRVDTDHGAQLIVYQSATSTSQGTWGPDQHASYAALRAAETGRPVVQAALTGDSVAFDARGRLLAWMGQSQHGVVTVRLGLPSAGVKTPYDRFGDYIPWASLAIIAVSAVILLVRRRGNCTGSVVCPVVLRHNTMRTPGAVCPGSRLVPSGPCFQGTCRGRRGRRTSSVARRPGVRTWRSIRSFRAVGAVSTY